MAGGNFTRKVTLITAPAGYGKTCLAASWIRDAPTANCWVSIDEKDNDPVRFLTYLLKSFRTTAPTIGEASLTYLRVPKLPPAEIILTPLINELSELELPTIIALDDYHIIQRLEIHQFMNFFIQNLPANLHLVIISRENPPFPLHNLRAKGQMEEIRQVDLSFTLDEAADFLNEAYEGNLSEDNVRLINQRTEGWITGIQLTALSLKSHPDPQAMLKDFGVSARYILDYLFQEIFQVQSEKYRGFLMKTSILEQVSPDLGVAVSGCTDSESILQELNQSNLFITLIEESGSWYRYHRLFLELLRQRLRLQKTLSAEELHLKASEWYEEINNLDESIHHALEGKHWKRAARQISQYSDDLLNNGRITTLLTWLKKIPIEFIKPSADYCLIFAWSLLLSGNLDGAESLIIFAEKAAKEKTEITGQIAAARAYLARAKGNEQEMVHYSEQALSLLPKADFSSRGIIALNLGIAYWHAGDMWRAEKPLKEALPAAHKSGNTYAEISAKIFLARISAVQGRLLEAADATGELITTGTGIPIEDLALTDMAMFHYEWNKLAKASEYIEKAMKNLQRGSIAEFTIASLMIKIRFLMVQGKFDEVKLIEEECLSIISRYDLSERMFSRWASLNVELALIRGNTTEAKTWLEQMTCKLDAHPFYRFLHLAPIRIYLAENNLAKAKDLLENAYREAKKRGWGYGMVWLLVRMALFDEREALALELLNEALSLGHAGNMTRTIAEVGPKLLPLLRKAAVSYSHPAYIGTIIKVIEKENESALSPDGNQVLSERETEVLHLIAAGLTNRQIAEQLVISINTVKSHVNHICTKLNAANRTQAAAQARSLRLIE